MKTVTTLAPYAVLIVLTFLFFKSCQSNIVANDTLRQIQHSYDLALRDVVYRDSIIKEDSIYKETLLASYKHLMHIDDSLVASLPHEQQKLKDDFKAVHNALLSGDTSTLKQIVLWANSH